MAGQRSGRAAGGLSAVPPGFRLRAAPRSGRAAFRMRSLHPLPMCLWTRRTGP